MVELLDSSILPGAAALLVLYRILNNALKAAYFGLGSISVIALAKKARETQPRLWPYLDNPIKLNITTQITDKLSLFFLIVVLLWAFGHPSIWQISLFFLYLVTFDLFIPNAIASTDPETVITRLFPVLRIPFLAVLPLTTLIMLPVRNGKRPDQEGVEVENPDDIRAFIQAGTDEGIIEEKEQSLLRNLLMFDDTLAREVMTPRTDMIAADSNLTKEDVLEIFTRTKHSRLPIYAQDLDHIEGILRLKDLVALEDKDENWHACLKQPLFIPENMNISDLMTDMLKRRLQMAIVIDEYGGTSGLITLENLIEEIVGEIHEEHELGTEEIIDLDDGSFLVAGKVLLEDFCERFSVEISDEHVDTVGGFIFNQEGSIPEVGETVVIGGIPAEITEADARRIYRVKVRPPEPANLTA